MCLCATQLRVPRTDTSRCCNGQDTLFDLRSRTFKLVHSRSLLHTTARAHARQERSRVLSRGSRRVMLYSTLDVATECLMVSSHPTSLSHPYIACARDTPSRVGCAGAR